MKELSTRTGYGTCRICDARKVKICKKVYLDGSMHFVDENDKSWNSSTCPSCYVTRRKLKRRVTKPESVSCVECAITFKPKLREQKFCGAKCRQKHHNDRRVLVTPEATQDLISKSERRDSSEYILEQAKKIMETHRALFKKLKESGD